MALDPFDPVVNPRSPLAYNSGVPAFDPLAPVADPRSPEYSTLRRQQQQTADAALQEGGSLARGYRSGALNVQGATNMFIGGAKEYAGRDPSANYAAGREALRQAGVAQPEINNWDQVNGVGSFAGYMGGAVGNALASYTPGLIATALTKRPMVGLATMYPMEAGETVAAFREDPNNTAPIGDVMPAALAKGGVNTALESVPFLNLFGTGALRGPMRALTSPRRFGAHMAAEGTTELAQEKVGQLARDYVDPQRDRSMDNIEMREAFLQGALGSAPFAGMATVAHKYRDMQDAAGPAVDRGIEIGSELMDRFKRPVDRLRESAQSRLEGIDLSEPTEKVAEQMAGLKERAAQVKQWTKEEALPVAQSIYEDASDRVRKWLKPRDRQKLSQYDPEDGVDELAMDMVGRHFDSRLLDDPNGEAFQFAAGSVATLIRGLRNLRDGVTEQQIQSVLSMDLLQAVKDEDAFLNEVGKAARLPLLRWRGDEEGTTSAYRDARRKDSVFSSIITPALSRFNATDKQKERLAQELDRYVNAVGPYADRKNALAFKETLSNTIGQGAFDTLVRYYESRRRQKGLGEAKEVREQRDLSALDDVSVEDDESLPFSQRLETRENAQPARFFFNQDDNGRPFYGSNATGLRMLSMTGQREAAKGRNANDPPRWSKITLADYAQQTGRNPAAMAAGVRKKGEQALMAVNKKKQDLNRALEAKDTAQAERLQQDIKREMEFVRNALAESADPEEVLKNFHVLRVDTDVMGPVSEELSDDGIKKLRYTAKGGGENDYRPAVTRNAEGKWVEVSEKNPGNPDEKRVLGRVALRFLRNGKYHYFSTRAMMKGAFDPVARPTLNQEQSAPIVLGALHRAVARLEERGFVLDPIHVREDGGEIVGGDNEETSPLMLYAGSQGGWVAASDLYKAAKERVNSREQGLYWFKQDDEDPSNGAWIPRKGIKGDTLSYKDSLGNTQTFDAPSPLGAVQIAEEGAGDMPSDAFIALHKYELPAVMEELNRRIAELKKQVAKVEAKLKALPPVTHTPRVVSGEYAQYSSKLKELKEALGKLYSTRKSYGRARAEINDIINRTYRGETSPGMISTTDDDANKSNALAALDSDAMSTNVRSLSEDLNDTEGARFYDSTRPDEKLGALLPIDAPVKRDPLAGPALAPADKSIGSLGSRTHSKKTTAKPAPARPSEMPAAEAKIRARMLGMTVTEMRKQLRAHEAWLEEANERLLRQGITPTAYQPDMFDPPTLPKAGEQRQERAAPTIAKGEPDGPEQINPAFYNSEQQQFGFPVTDAEWEKWGKTVAEATVQALPTAKKFSHYAPTTTKAPLTEEEQAAIIKQIEKRLGAGKIDVNFTDRAPDDGAVGMYGRRTPTPGKAPTGEFITILINLGKAKALTTAYHEAMHALFDRLLHSGREGQRAAATLQTLADNAHAREQMKHLLRSHPAALESALSSPEEFAAYAYQFWEMGMFKLAPAPKSLFERIWTWINSMLGILSADEKTARLFSMFSSGKFAEPSAVNGVIKDANITTLGDKLESISPTMFRAGSALLMGTTDRLRQTGVPSLIKLSDMFHVDPDRERGRLPFLQRRAMAKGKWQARLNAIFVDTTNEQRQEALTELYKGTDSAKPEVQKLVAAVRDFLSKEVTDDDPYNGGMYQYLLRAGVMHTEMQAVKQPDGTFKNEPVDVAIRAIKNYFPQAWDSQAIREDKNGMVDLLRTHLRMELGEAQEIVDKLSYDDSVQLPDGATYTPYMTAVHTRKLVIPPRAREAFAKYMQRDIVTVLSSYVHQAVHRAEYSRDFGHRGQKITALIDRAKEEGATSEQLSMANKAVSALTGTLGSDFNPATRRFMQGLIAYENVVLLPLVLLTNFLDVFGVAVRSGKMGDAWRAFRIGMEGLGRQIARKGPDEKEKLSQLLGLIDDSISLQAYGEVYDGQYANSFSGRVNERFFRWNGMQTWNTRMRVAGMVTAIDFIKEHAELAKKGDKTSLRYLEELNLKPSDVVLNDAGEMKLLFRPGEIEDIAHATRIQQAIFRFVDGGVIRPNAAHRPIWGSDPRYMLLFHLKQFTYSFQQVILKQVEKESKHGNFKPGYIMLTVAPFSLAINMFRSLLLGRPIDTSFGAVASGLAKEAMHSATGVFGAQLWTDMGVNPLPGSGLLGPTANHAFQVLRTVGGSPTDSWLELLVRSTPGSPLVKAAM